MLKNMTTAMRLGTGFCAVLLLLIVVAALAIASMAQMNDRMAEIANIRVPQLIQATRLQDSSDLIALSVRNILLTTDKAEVDRNQAALVKTRKDIAELNSTIKKGLHTEEGRALFQRMQQPRDAYDASINLVLSLAADGRRDEGVQLLFGIARPAQSVYYAALNEFEKYQLGSIGSAAREAEQTYQDARLALLTLTIVAVLLGIAISWLITRRLIAQLGGEPAYAAEIAQRIAAGDLTARVAAATGSDSMLASMQKMQVQLSHTVRQIKASSDSVAQGAREIAAGNADLSSRTEEQASALEETAASMEEMTATVAQNAENAKKANQLAAQASGEAVQSGVAVREVVETMEDITKSSRKIADIISVIDGIAFQTNILALNAAVEAARAGEQGRGFAVVASEVRSLAQRSAVAAKEIKNLISDSVSKVETGSRQVDDAGEKIEKVVGSVKRVSNLIAEIAAASQEQSQGIEQVSETVTQIEKVTQQNAAMVEEASAAAASLEEQAAQLLDAVAAFKVDAGGHIAAHRASTPSAAGQTSQGTIHEHARPPSALPKRRAKTELAAVGDNRARPAAGKPEGWEEF